MKKIIALIVLSISTLFVFQSCDGDDTPIEEKETLRKRCILRIFLHMWKSIAKIARPPYILTCMSRINSKHLSMEIPMWWQASV